MATKLTNPGEKQAKLPEEKQVNNHRSATSETPRDGQNSLSGSETPQKRRRVAQQSPGVSRNGAQPQQIFTVEETSTVPKFIVVESADPSRPLNKLNPFIVNKWIEGVSCQLSNKMRRFGSGFLFNCDTERIAKVLLNRNDTELLGVKLKVSAHRTLNYSRGVIKNMEALADMTEDDIVDWMKEKGVTKVERCVVKKEGIKIPTNTYFLTFARPNLPEKIRIGWMETVVHPYLPKPLQCYQCFKFGHPSAKCHAQAVCGRCGHEPHENACPTPPKCSNCKGDHAPTSKKCPVYTKELEIKKAMVINKISFQEAKKQADARTLGKSFAAAAATPSATSKQQAQTQIKAVSSSVQFGVDLPDALRMEALALAKGLLEELRAKGRKPPPTKDASAQFAAEAQSKKKKKQTKSATSAAEAVEQTFRSATQAGKAAKRAERSAKQVPKPANTPSQAKPGEASAPQPKQAEAKQAEGPAPNETPGNAPAPAHPAAAGIPGKPTSAPAKRSGSLSGSTLTFGFGVEVPPEGEFVFGAPVPRKKRSPVRPPTQRSFSSPNLYQPLSGLSEDRPKPPRYPSEIAAEEEGIWHNPLGEDGRTEWA